MLASEHSGKPASTDRLAAWHHHQGMRAMAKYFRANPQVFILFMVCVVLGLGTFIAVLIALVQTGTTTPSGEPSGVIAIASHLWG
jgi:hypothetical protein